MKSLLISGTTPGDITASALDRAFGSAARFSEDAPFDLKIDSPIVLILSVLDPNVQNTQAPKAVAPTAAVPLLTAQWGTGELIVGPLTLPKTPGCWNCASTRMALAAASARVFDGAQVPPNPLDPDRTRGSQVLISEIREIFAGGAEQSRLVNHLLIWDAISDRTSLHRVVPLSHCAICGGISTATEATDTQASPSIADRPEEVLQKLAGWVDRRTGIVPRLMLELQGDEGTELPVVATTSPPFAMKEDGTLRQLPSGWGKGLTISEAILSAVGEAIERYSASMPEPARIIWNRPDELVGEFMDPRTLGLYSEAQYQRADFPYVRFDPTVRHPWVLGRWLSNATPVWIPAIFVFLWIQLFPENQIYQGSSNGLAASTDLEHATLRATLELVERDAFLAAWFTASPGQRIQLDDTLDPQLKEVLNTIESCGAAIELYFLPTTVCGSVAMCLALGDGAQYPGVTIGLAADLDPLSALRRAILELGQTGTYLRRMMRSGAAVPDSPSAVREMLQHAIYYFPAERAVIFNRVRSASTPVSLCDIPRGNSACSLANVASSLHAAGVRVAVVDVTSPDLTNGPFHVARAVSPDLQDISYGYGLDRLPTKRILSLGLSYPIPEISPIW